MDHLVDKELDGWSDLECQWLNVQLETGDKWRSSGVGVGISTVQHLVGNMDRD